MSARRFASFAVAAAALLAGCSFQNRYEREATAITQAVIANDLRPVQNDIEPGVKITRVQVAQWSDELNQQGKLLSLKEIATNCPVGAHCFDVRFAKRNYVEVMRLDERGKVVGWSYHPADAFAQ